MGKLYLEKGLNKLAHNKLLTSYLIVILRGTKSRSCISTRYELIPNSWQISIWWHTNWAEISIILHVELFKFGEDVLPIGELAQCRDVWTYLCDKHLALWWVCNINHLLHNIVCKLVLHHGIQGAVRTREQDK